MRVQFEDCQFDPETHEVFRSGRAVSLSPKAFHLLELLIRERPKAMDHRKLHAELWPRTFVTDANLPNLVAELPVRARGRRSPAAHHPNRARFRIRVQRFGARGARRRAAFGRGSGVPADLGNREIALALGQNGIGRAADSTLWIDDSAVSRRHACIVVDTSGAVLEDLGSKNGTLVRGRRISGRQETFRQRSDSDRPGPLALQGVPSDRLHHDEEPVAGSALGKQGRRRAMDRATSTKGPRQTRALREQVGLRCDPMAATHYGKSREESLIPVLVLLSIVGM